MVLLLLIMNPINSRCKINFMSPRFRVAHDRNMTGPFKSQVASYAEHRVALTISFDFTKKLPLLCHIHVIFSTFQHIFVSFLQCFYHPGTLTVTASSDNCDNSIHFQIIVAKADCME